MQFVGTVSPPHFLQQCQCKLPMSIRLKGWWRTTQPSDHPGTNSYHTQEPSGNLPCRVLRLQDSNGSTASDDIACKIAANLGVCRNLWDSPEPNANERKLSIHLLQFWSPTGFGPKGAGNPIAKQVANIFQNLLERVVKVGLSLRTLGNHTGNLKDSGKSTLKNGNLAACARHTWAILQQTQSQLPLSLAAASTWCSQCRSTGLAIQNGRPCPCSLSTYAYKNWYKMLDAWMYTHLDVS